jgi:hypothetical protein
VKQRFLLLESRSSGGRGQVVKAVGCGSTIRGFEPRRSPFYCRNDFDGRENGWYINYV